jgi:hypothetical protein
MGILLKCWSCGGPLKVSEKAAGESVECPRCRQILLVPEACGSDHQQKQAITTVPPQEAPSTSLTAQPGAEEIYRPEDAATRICPRCKILMEPAAILCVACGYNRKTGQTVEKRVERIDEDWHLGLPLVARISVASVLAGLGLLICLLAGGVWPGLAIAVLVILVLALAFGTYFDVHLVRNTRGKTSLTKRWWVSFVPVTRQTIDPRAFERLVLHYHRGPTIAHLVLLIALLLIGVCPGLFWWLWLMTRETIILELSDTARQKRVVIFYGASENAMQDVVDWVKEVSELPFERAT